MTWVKICGITNLEDALTAVDAGADALGFVFYEKSPRHVDVGRAKDVISKLPDSIEKVGVFVYSKNLAVGEIAQDAGLSAVQMHFDASVFGQDVHLAVPEHLKQYWAFPAVSMTAAQGTSGTFYIPMRRRDAIFLDSGTTRQPGGTGKTFDWGKTAAMVESMNRHSRVVVAGGLTPENVKEAVRVLHPWGVDVSSGVEASPGKKDAQKVRAFIKAVRESEKN